MHRNRRTRLLTALFALVNLVFMQLALAGYVCSGDEAKVAGMVVPAGMAAADMPCAEFMPIAKDVEQPNLCHAHCQDEQQSSDTYRLPSVAAIGALPADFSAPVLLPSFSEAPMQAPFLRRTTAPPVAIQNCCFRL